jgi:hypothetical protein
MNIEVTELRSGERFALLEPLAGSFGGVEIWIRNLAEQGAQVEHAEPLRIGMRARLWFKRGDVAVSTRALLVWSHLSRTPSGEGNLYASGMRIEEEPEGFVTALQRLASRGLLSRDHSSLDRKKQRLAERELERAARPVIKFLRQDVVPSEQALLVEHARARLRANPDEALKWYNRARFATDDAGAPIAADDLLYHRQDVLAVWEYLERSVPLALVARVFEGN